MLIDPFKTLQRCSPRQYLGQLRCWPFCKPSDLSNYVKATLPCRHYYFSWIFRSFRNMFSISISQMSSMLTFLWPFKLGQCQLVSMITLSRNALILSKLYISHEAADLVIACVNFQAKSRSTYLVNMIVWFTFVSMITIHRLLCLLHGCFPHQNLSDKFNIKRCVTFLNFDISKRSNYTLSVW